MELVITLAVNHPLGAVTVTTEKRVGVTSAQWNTWMLQMTTFLMHQVISYIRSMNHHIFSKEGIYFGLNNEQ